MIDLLAWLVATFWTPASVLSLVTTSLSLVGLKLTGDGNIKGFYLGIVNQCLWFLLALVTGAYGLLPMCFVYAVVYNRNIRKWRQRDLVAPTLIR